MALPITTTSITYKSQQLEIIGIVAALIKTITFINDIINSQLKLTFENYECSLSVDEARPSER